VEAIQKYMDEGDTENAQGALREALERFPENEALLALQASMNSIEAQSEPHAEEPTEPQTQAANAAALYRTFVQTKAYQNVVSTKTIMTAEGYGNVFRFDSFLFALYDTDADGTDELFVRGTVSSQDDAEDNTYVWYIFTVLNRQVELLDAIHGADLFACERENTLYSLDQLYGNDCFAFSLYELNDGVLKKTHSGSTEWIMNENTQQMQMCYYMDGKAYGESEFREFTGETLPLQFGYEEMLLSELN
jgi:hypothetical protein